MRKTPLILLLVLIAAVVAFILLTHRTEAPVVVPAVPDPTAEVPASKDDLIVLTSPLPKADVSSPLTVTGRARGQWYFEASFPITLVNWDGLIIGEGYATADGEWMTTEYVPFTGTITFTAPDTSVSDRGWIILHKNNASGLPEHDNALEVEITYK